MDKAIFPSYMEGAIFIWDWGLLVTEPMIEDVAHSHCIPGHEWIRVMNLSEMLLIVCHWMVMYICYYCLKSSVKQKLRYIAYYVSANMPYAFVVDTYISVMSYG